jgi:hypothetical protein
MRKKINWLVNLIRNILRILCVFTFFHWIIFTSYAGCTNYYESINKAESHKEEVKYGDNKQTIAEIEEKILKEIEAKRKTSGLKREWKDKWLSELEGTPNSSEGEKKEYSEKLKKAKEETIKNIQDQLRGNNLDITELDDQRVLWKRIWYDPLKFFFISPLNRFNRLLNSSLNLQEPFLLEIIFKLLIVKLFFAFFINYSEKEAGGISKELGRMQDPSLSVEEKEEIQQEISPLIWRGIFNFLTSLLIFFLTVFHPCFVDRNDPRYLVTSSWWKWFLPVIGITFFSSIINEFLRQGQILKVKEIKEYLSKSWFGIIIASLIFNIIFPYIVPTRSSYGFLLIIFFSGLIDLVINIIKVGIIWISKKNPKD